VVTIAGLQRSTPCCGAGGNAGSLGAALGLAGCAGVGTVQDQIAVADAKLRASGPNVDSNNVEIRGERVAAATWTRESLPQFAPRLQTRLLPKPVKPLS
jgi:hypothetical protein